MEDREYDLRTSLAAAMPIYVQDQGGDYRMMEREIRFCLGVAS